MSQTLDQRIAQATHAAATRETFAEQEFRNAIKKAATRVRVSGLGVTLAFALGKGEQHLEVAQAWCRSLRALGDSGLPTDAKPETLLTTYRSADAAHVRRLTDLSMRILEWLAKWADAYKKPENQSNS